MLHLGTLAYRNNLETLDTANLQVATPVPKCQDGGCINTDRVGKFRDPVNSFSFANE